MQPLSKLEQEVATLGDISRDELIGRWVTIYDCPPPPGVRRELMERAIGFYLQARKLGGLSASSRRAIKSEVTKLRAKSASRHLASEVSLAGGSMNRTAGPDAISREVQKPKSGGESRSVPRPGSRLMRDWNGRTHVVDVVEDGFVFGGETYRSLSAIARKITGAHWSGPRFFGL